MDTSHIVDILKIVWPLLILQLFFQIYALYDLFKKRSGKTKNLNAPIWAAIIVVGEIFGPAFYFLIGRIEE